MIINKENMINMLQVLIEREKNGKYDTLMHGKHDNDVYKNGYVTALENLLFTISVNGE